MSLQCLFATLFAGGALPRRLRALVIALAGLLGSGMAQATVFNFDGRTIGGCTLTDKEYSCPSASAVNGNDQIVIASGYTLRIDSSFGFGRNQGLTMRGTARLVVAGHFSIADMRSSHLDVSGGSIEVGGTFYMGGSAQTMSAHVSAGAIQLGSDKVTITGSLTSRGLVSISSGSKITGDVSGTVITTGASTTIVGNVSAGSRFTLASGSTVDGNVDAGDLLLQSSKALITGNASVNAATLEWAGRVAGSIVCKNGTATGKCDCVTNNSGFPVNTENGPRCEGPGPAAPHHFRISHDGEGDTCLPEQITVTACANAACTAPHYTGTVSGTLSPFGESFTIGENTGSAVVSATRVAAGNADLGVSGASGTSCYRSSDNSTSCTMSFSGGTKLKLSVPAHAAGTEGMQATVEAFKANDEKTACVAAYRNADFEVRYSCSYSKPATGTLPVELGGKSLACASGTTASIKTVFNAEGSAQLSFRYADAGEVRLKALIDDKKKGQADGEGSVVTAPASFLIEPASGTIRAGAGFDVKITARNAAGATTPNFDTAGLGNAGATRYSVAFGVACHAQGGDKASIAPASPGFAAGVAAFKAAWPEVGTIDLDARLDDFLGSGAPAAAGSTNTAGAGNCAGKVGPFIPAYYRVALANGRAFYYSGEPFPLLVSAMNKAGELTLNYSAALGLSEAVTLAANDKTGAAFAPAPGALSGGAIAATAFTNGVASGKPAYTFTLWPAAPTQVRLRASNGKAGGLEVLSSSDEAMPAIRSGRLRIGNRFGRLKTTLSVPITAEYWTGKSWLLNSDDIYTAIPHDAFAIKPLADGMTVQPGFPASPLKLAGGAAAFDLRVSAGGPGPVDIALNLGDTTQDNACIGTAIGTRQASKGGALPWLRAVTTGCETVKVARDPYGRATFGVYTPENRRIIHVREVFN